MSDISKRIQNLSPARQRLLERLNAGDARGVRSYPIAYSQLGMWFIDQLEPETPLYNMPFGSRYKGAMNHAAMWRAIGELVERHESLRTIFPTRNGVAVQEVLPKLVDFSQTIDLSTIAVDEREDELTRQIQAQTMTSFQLAKGPLFRAILFRMDELDHVVYFNMHHIIGDGWSCYILQRELDTLYNAYSNGAEVSPLPKPQLQFGDYTLWQRGWLNGEVMTQHLAFWKKELDGVEEATIPSDYPRPSVLAHQGRALQKVYSAELSRDITELCRRENATPFMVFLAVFQLALARYVGIHDFLIGTPTANRNRLETENIVGCLMNTIVLRSCVSAGLSFRELVARVRERTLSAYEYQEMPFEKLVEELVPVQTLSRTPLFQAMFSMQNYPSSKEIQDLEQTEVDIGMDMTKLEMTMSMAEQDGIYGCVFEYDADLFDPARMQRMMEYFSRLLEAMVADPGADIANDVFLPDVERQHAQEWGRQGGQPHDGMSAMQRFELAVRRHANAVAITCVDETLTYSQLNERANRIANYLSKAGVGPELRVGVLLERGVHLYAAMLGVMKAGGVYAPLDPTFPEDRLAHMAADSSLAVLLLDAQTRHLLVDGDWKRIDLDQVSEELLQMSGENLPCRVDGDHLAYIIYTSGSTGKPKGVGLPQRALINQLHWYPATFALCTQDRFLQKTSISFDGSITEILAPLVSGASLVVARPRGEYDPQYLAELVAEQGITCLDLSPSLLDALMALVDPATWRKVRLVISGGEALRPEHVRFFKEHFTARLVNTYGPTETAIQSVWSDQLDGQAVVPIGRPVTHTELYVLDAQMRLAPVGTRGELFIGGIGLARGYLGHPGLTAAKFVPNPFGRHGERLYRTGDQVRWRPDGQLEFLGRTDHQIKLRGYRIELSEIERAIESYAGVAQAIVVIRENQPGMQQLVAYVVNDTTSGSALRACELREHLTKSLPTYMVPVAFVSLGDIPLMPNGKLDRAALPAPEQADFPAHTYEPPQGETEQSVAAIFEEVLKIEKVGRRDNFFELGGHSLLAVQLISRIQRALDRQFRLVDLFAYPTVQQMAQVLEQTQAPQARLPALHQPTLRKQAPLSFAQQRLWFLNQIEDVGSAYNIPLGLVLNGRLDRAALRQALDHLLWRHEVLRTTFPTVNEAPVQSIAAASDTRFQLDEEDLRASTDPQAVRRRIETEANAMFDLAQGPLIRGRLIRTGDEEHVLLVTVHHIIADGWSINLFWNDFVVLYRAFQAGQSNPLPALGYQYADYAQWQRQWLSGDVLAQQQSYWKRTLQEAPAQLALPTDRPRPAQQDFAGDFVDFQLDAELTAGLRRLSQTHGVTLYMTLLAAWSVVLSRLSGQREVVIGTPTANRPMRELEELIGFFVNMLALRMDVPGTLSVSQLLTQACTTFLEAQEHEHLSFEQVVEAVRPPRDPAYSPIFQVMLTWHAQSGQGDGGESLPGLAIRGVDMPAPRKAKFDLTLALEEQGTTIGGGLEYATSLFERATIERFLVYLHRVLQAMVRDPAQAISRLDMLPPAERSQVLHGWNTPAERSYEFEDAHRMIEAQARRTPERIAVVQAADTLSYAQLNAQANQLARRLRAEGVGADVRVGLCVERGTAMVVAMLAVLKAGGAYVPLDPAYPPARLQAMLADAAPAVVLTQSALHAALDGWEGSCLDLDDRSMCDGQPDDDLPAADGLTPAHLAYLIYTSGSTGTPKGVMLQRANLANFLRWGQEAFDSAMLAQTLAATSLSFDLAVFEILLPLSCGGTVQVVANVLELAKAPVPVTLVNTVPSALEVLLDEGMLPPTVQVVNLAGEALKPALVQRVFAQPQVQLVHNLYGPTETTTYSTYTRITREDNYDGHIGTPIANTRIYILDAQGEPVPVGVSGELYIAGAGVARGYNQREALTGECFKRDPFVPDESARMYRTGDLARWRADGRIDYLGRADQQIKLRGYRIELGEIEQVLEQQSTVRQAAVLIREDVPGHKQLVAYVVGQGDGDVATWRKALMDALPAYMVPAAFVLLHAMPLTPNGKLDRKALPAPDHGEAAAHAYEPPQGETEQRVAAIFEEVLKIEKVGRRDNFFELGGHSLLAVQLVRRIGQLAAMEFRLQNIFKLPTPAAIAAWIAATPGGKREELLEASSVEGIVALTKDIGRQPVFFVHPVGGTAFCYVELARLLEPQASVYALESNFAEDDDVLGMPELARHYLQRLRRVQPSGPYRLAGWSFGGLLAWEMAVQLREQGESVSQLVMIDTHPPQPLPPATSAQRMRRVISYVHADLLGQDGGVAMYPYDLRGGLEVLENLLVRRGLAAEATRRQETAQLVATYDRNLYAMETYSVPSAEQMAVLFIATEGEHADRLRDAWSCYTHGLLDCIALPANHYTIVKGACIQLIAQRMRRDLDGAPADGHQPLLQAVDQAVS